MKDNAIVGFFKLCGTLLLAFLVGMTYFQSAHREEVEQEVKKKVDLLQSELQGTRQAIRDQQTTIREQAAIQDRLAGQVEALKDVFASGALVPGGSGSGNRPPLSNGDGPRREPANPSVPRGADAAPGWLSPAAKELWGRRPNYLVPDPAPIPVAALDTEGADPNGELRLFYGAQPSKLNPLTASDANVSNRIQQYCLSTIASPHARDASKYEGDLALRVEVNEPDHTEYVIFLRNDVWWQTPALDPERYAWIKGRHQLTAHDIKFTLDLILNPDVDCEHLRNYFSECLGCEVIDDFCCIVRWKKPQHQSISFTLSGFGVLPKFLLSCNEVGKPYEDWELGVAFNEHWLYRDFKYVGSGPYRVAELDPDSHLLLVRNEEYYGELPSIRAMRQRFNNDNEAGMRLLETRDVHAETFQPRDWHKKTVEEAGKKTIFTDGSLGHVWVQGTGFTFIGWKNSHPIFKDPRVRKAMTLACNRKRMLENLFIGHGTIVSAPQPVDSPYYAGIEPLPFDLAAARAELEAAGWADRDGDGIIEKTLEDGTTRPFRFVATIPSGVETWRSLFTIFGEDLSKIGIRMVLEALDWKIFVNKLDTRDFECVSLAWQNDGWESDLTQIWHSKQADVSPSSNFIEYRNPRADSLMDALRETFDVEQRIRMQHELQAILHEDQPYTFLISTRAPYVWWKDTVGGVEAAAGFLQRPRVRYMPMWVKAR